MAAPMPVEPMIAPAPNSNQADALGVVSRKSVATRVITDHRNGLLSRRQRDLLAEKLLLHIDGSGEQQWADIFQGTRIAIPRIVSDFRLTENLLRPIVDNAVAHHTTMPLRFFASGGPDRRSRDRALVDSLWVNDLADRQDWNGLFSDALYMAMPAGFCPIHAYWRDDAVDAYEPVGYGEGPAMGPAAGMIDCWLGNPFDTVFDRGAKRGSVYSCTYGRVLPLDMVKRAFGHIPGVDTLVGTTKIPSAATYQRIARTWRTTGLGVHGTATLDFRPSSKQSHDELLVVICREILPGVDPDWPNGRLTIVGVPGDADLLIGKGGSEGLVLADQALPGGDYSWSLFYSHHQSDDIHGKPWVADLDELQVRLNIGISKLWEFLNKQAEAPIVGPGGALSEDMLDLDGYNYLELDPAAAGWRPRVMEWSQSVIPAYERYNEGLRKAMYTIGGYQASSRGESPGSRTPYRAIVALQQADNTIHGPVDLRYRKSACEFAVRCWKQMKMYGDIGWMVNIVGDEYAHLVEPYIDNSKLSDRPPIFKMVNAFGPSPELRAQEILELMALKGADGEVFLTTEQARRHYPNPSVFGAMTDPKAVSQRRAKTVAQGFLNLANRIRQESGFEGGDMADPTVAQLALRVFMKSEGMFPRMQDDDLKAHLDAYSEIIQDETADPIARHALVRRQQLYFQWQAEMAGVVPTGPTATGTPAPQRNSLNPTSVALQMRGAAPSPQAAG